MEEARENESVVQKWLRHLSKITQKCMSSPILVLSLFNVYSSVAVYKSWEKSSSWCYGIKFLLVISVIIHIYIFYSTFLKQRLHHPYFSVVQKLQRITCIYDSMRRCNIPRSLPSVVLLMATVSFLIYDTWNDKKRMISGAGMLTFLFIAYVFSVDRKKVRWRPVFWGVGLQFLFALLILRFSWGRSAFSCIGDKLKEMLENTDYGSAFLYGYLSKNHIAGKPTKPVFFFHVLSVIFFSSCLVSVLYYCGVMQTVIKKLGWLLQITVGTTACESMNTAANIFLGPIESPLVIRPYIHELTKSELHAVLAGGFATVSGTVFSAFINVGANAGHLLTASVMSAPASLAMSKLLYPELEESKTRAIDIAVYESKEKNVLEAALNGAVTAVSLVGNIASNLLAFMAAVHAIDIVISVLTGYIGLHYINLQWITSLVMIPFTYLMGIEWKDCIKVSDLIGIKTIVHPFIGYSKLGVLKKQAAISPRSEAIANYALCGFSHIGALGVQLGGLTALAPGRQLDIASVAFRALMAGSLASFMTACAAGLLLPTFNEDH